MRIQAKSITSLVTLAGLVALSGCASQAPRVTNASLGYAITNYQIDADSDEQALSTALNAALSNGTMASAMPASANIEIQRVRYNSVILGFFYGGQHYATLDVTLEDSSGRKVANFPLNIAADGSRGSADADLAASAANIIAAKAANAFMPLQMAAKTAPKLMAQPLAKAPDLEPMPGDVVEPQAEVVPSNVDPALPCVIGPDGKCLSL